MDLVSKTITNLDKHHFDQFWKIYNYSFPDHEKRSLESQKKIFCKENYSLMVYLNIESLVGFISFWMFERYMYIEHFAINIEHRGKGIGGQILRRFAEQSNLQILLEIDPIVDEISENRLRFYSSLGYFKNAHKHLHPAYQPGYKPYELVILSYPGCMSQNMYDIFTYDLKNRIVKNGNM